MKIMYFDCETTGVDVNLHDITQLAGMIEVDGEVLEKFNYNVRPFNLDTVDQEALLVTGKTLDEISKYEDPRIVHGNFIQLLDCFVDRYNKLDKIYPAGYNVSFDVSFLRNFFEKCDDKYYGSFFSCRTIDPYPVLQFLEGIGKFESINYKLTTICEKLGIEIDAHDAMNDIVATRKVIDYVKGRIL